MAHNFRRRCSTHPPFQPCSAAITSYAVYGFPNGGITAQTPRIEVAGMGDAVPGTTKASLLAGG